MTYKSVIDIFRRGWALFRESPSEFISKSIRIGHDDWLRPHLPHTVVSYNGISVLGARVGDRFTWWHTTNLPSYEGTLVASIREHVSDGDTVVVVGGGWGVTTVAAAQQVGSDGKVHTYEGAEEEVSKVKTTIKLNDVAESVTVNHAVVGKAHSLRGSMGGATTVPPEELPDCDVLVLDCEGAEIGILETMAIDPRAVLVETHGMHGASERDVETKLRNRDYEVTNQGVAEERVRNFCLENDVYILVGTRAE